MENLEKRGRDAAAAYLERCNIQPLERDYVTVHGDIDIVALDIDTLVHVTVSTYEGPIKAPRVPTKKELARRGLAIQEYMGDNRVSLDYRIDAIELIVLAEDRALLRHHRAVGGPDDEPT